MLDANEHQAMWNGRISQSSKAIGEKDAKEALAFDTDYSVEFSPAPPLVSHGKDEAGLQAWTPGTALSVAMSITPR
jgi:hypothetical protein